jgi:peptide/nickel transport system permease protein
VVDLKKTKFILKRLGNALVTLTVLSFIIFSLLFLAPGDPARNLVGTRAATPELLEIIRAQHNLDQPFLVQYAYWISGALRLDFGTSIRAGTDVVQYISSFAILTFQLVGLALLFSIIFGLLLGIYAAKSKGTFRDSLINVLALVGTSAPGFAVGLLLLYLFAFQLQLFPVFGSGTIRHLILPAITLSIGICASVIKITRQAILSEITADYTAFMRARAFSPVKITFAQLKNASPTILTSSGIVLASLFGGTVLVETVFSLPGLGGLLASSVTFRDVPVVQFIALMMATIICLTSALVDILAYLLNPNAVASSNSNNKQNLHQLR